jgi:hypothetical protein
MRTFKAWNGQNWETFKTFKAACSMLSERFNNYIKSADMEAAADMDGEQIHINTEKDEYSYAHVEIVKGDFTVKKY